MIVLNLFGFCLLSWFNMFVDRRCTNVWSWTLYNTVVSNYNFMFYCDLVPLSMSSTWNISLRYIARCVCFLLYELNVDRFCTFVKSVKSIINEQGQLSNINDLSICLSYGSSWLLHLACFLNEWTKGGTIPIHKTTFQFCIG